MTNPILTDFYVLIIIIIIIITNNFYLTPIAKVLSALLLKPFLFYGVKTINERNTEKNTGVIKCKNVYKDKFLVET